MVSRRSLLLFAILLGSFAAHGREVGERSFPPPVPVEGCTDCFGLQARPAPGADYSYEPLLQSKPFGELNCGHRINAIMAIEASLQAYAPFQEFVAGSSYREVIFQGTGENAINCMILLARVQEKRLDSSTLMEGTPLLYKWKQLLLKYDPLSGVKVIWVPVLPSAAEAADSGYLQRTAKQMLASLGTPLEELHANRVQLTVGFKRDWVTLTLSKDRSGTVAQIINVGMGSAASVH